MIEFSIQKNHKLLQDFKKLTFTIGLKPMFSFNGPLFDSHPVYQHVKSLFLDFSEVKKLIYKMLLDYNMLFHYQLEKLKI